MKSHFYHGYTLQCRNVLKTAFFRSGTRSDLALRRWISPSNPHPLPALPHPPPPYVVYIDRCITATAKQNKTNNYKLINFVPGRSTDLLHFRTKLLLSYETAIELTKSTRFHTIFHACYSYSEPDYVIYGYNIYGY